MSMLGAVTSFECRQSWGQPIIHEAADRDEIRTAVEERFLRIGILVRRTKKAVMRNLILTAGHGKRTGS